MSIVNNSGDPTNPNNRYVFDTELPTPDGSAELKKDLSGHRPGDLILQQLLQYAFDNLTAAAKDPTNDILENIFSYFTYYKTDTTSTNLLDHVRDYMAKTKFEVRGNYPKREYPLPIVAVHVREEGESSDETQTFHHEMVHTDPNSLKSEELVGQVLDQVVDIIVITDDPLTTMIVYRLVWFICFANKFDLESYADVHELRMSGGAISFDQEQFPNWQYSRMVTLRYKTLFDFYMPPVGPPKSIRLYNMMIVPAVIQTGDPPPGSKVPATPTTATEYRPGEDR
jgi:hypothetical protein